MISVREIVIFKEGHPVVGDVSFDLAPGACTVLTGKSGTGKTSVIEVLAGIARPDRGSIVVDSIDLFSSPSYVWNAYYNSLGIVTEQRDLLPMSVRDNIALPLDSRDRKDSENTITNALSTWNLQGCATKKPYALSKSEVLRTALARATIHGPNIVLLDEPLSDLSLEEQSVALQQLQTLKNNGTSLLIASRDASAFSSLSPQVVSLEHGTQTVEHVSPPVDPVAEGMNKQSAKKAATKVAKIRVT